MTMSRFRCMCLAVIVVSMTSSTAMAAATDDLQAKVGRLEQLVDRQGQRIAELEAQQKGELTPEEKRNFLALYKELQADAGNRVSMGWLENFTIFGDLRLRYHLEKPDDSTSDKHRGRFRLRVGAKKTWLEKQFEVGFRLASGSSDDPTSTNQTWTGNFSEKRVWIDLAYAKYQPKPIKGFMIVGGKMKNPFVHTNMIWDSDVNPEGVFAVYKYPGFGTFVPFAGFGFFQLVHNSNDPDAELHAYQAGFTWGLIKDVKWTSALSYYDFNNFDENFSSAANGNTESGGRLTAENFRVLNVTNKVGWKAFKLPMSIYVDYAHNSGNELGGQSDAFAVGCKIGENKKKGDWSAKYKYAFIEANATPGRFNDSDFGHSNREGHQFGAVYSITDFLTASLNVFCTEPITGSDEDNTMFLVLADLIWKF